MAEAATFQGALPAAEEHMPARRILAFFFMVVGMFMAILDIQVVSASLAEIQAGLSASSDEIPWVQTAYLIAEVIMIPLSGTLAHILSTRVLFAVSAAGFTAASVLCATATNIDQMIVYRALQGFIGGGMIPSVFAAAFSIFPKSKRAIVSPIIGLVATLAPTIGPTVGGYLTSALSWHWLFLINVFPGIIVALAAWFLIDFDKPERSLIAKFDWWGLVGLAAFLGSLEYVLEEGPPHDWLADDNVMLFSVVMVCGAVLFFWRVFRAEFPVVDLSAFTNVNFSVGALFSFVLGIGLYGLTYLYPLYLGSIRGYDSMMIGETVFVSGLAMFFTAPFAGQLAVRVDPRIMMMVGFLIFAAGTFLMSRLTADWAFAELLAPQILRGVGLMLCMVTINNTALGTLPPVKLRGASGLFNLTRNLGGAIGLAVINTTLTHRTALHHERLAEHVNWNNPVAVDQLASLSQNAELSGLDGKLVAMKQLGRLVQQQAFVLSFVDVFLLLTALFGILAFGALLMRRPAPEPGGAGH